MKYLIVYFSFFINILNAMNCSDYKDFQLYDGHYYSVSIDKLTFDSAKQIAINNGGSLAIPNSQAENDFIKSLIGGGSIGWIGIHDPNKLQNYCYGSNCAYDSSRFRDVKNNSLLYKNFHAQQPDNLVKQYDVVDGKQMVSPLGEHWVAMSGTNGKWLDIGNHADEYNNPVKYKAVFEFETLNECTPPTDDGVQELTGRFCNTKIWDTAIDAVTIGQTLDCQTDVNGNEYCPSALAQCAQQWDYENGYSLSGVGSVTDYANKVTQTSSYSCNYSASVSGTQNLGWVFLYQSEGDTNMMVDGTYAKISGTNNNISFGIPSLYMAYCTSGTIDYPPLWGVNIGLIAYCKVPNYSCPNGGTLSGSTCVKTCTTSTLVCPGGYSDNGSNCKKTIEYTYYNYLCNSSQNTQGYNYLPINSGGNCNKTDPNTSTVNASTLDDACNNSTPPTNNCKREKFLCQANEQRPCSYVDNKWQCSPFPCFGQSNLENLDTEVGSSDKNNDGWTEDGSCAGTIHIFNGKSNKCRSWDMFFGLTGGGCCDKDKVAAGLVACKENEKLLAKKREKKHTHYIGNFCSKKISLGFTKICVQKSDGYCVFNSSLARIIQEQGRSQLNISWGSAENPQCRGFTPEEFQKIDFSKIDLTEFVKDIQSSVQTSVIQNLSTYVKDKVEDFYGN